jgi:hypothetical protein
LSCQENHFTADLVASSFPLKSKAEKSLFVAKGREEVAAREKAAGDVTVSESRRFLTSEK